MRSFAAGLRFQLTTMRGSIADFQPLITVPFFTVIFLSITEYAGRPDLAPYAVLAPPSSHCGGWHSWLPAS